MINQYIPTLLNDPYTGLNDSSTPQAQTQMPQYTQYQGINPIQLAQMLRNQGSQVTLPSDGLPQMTGIPGMGSSTGTGLTYGTTPLGFGGYAPTEY